MIQFTLGCILIALTLFFGGKDLLSNQDIIENSTRTVKNEESKIDRAKSVQQKFAVAQENAILQSSEVRVNLINQLNINESKYKVDLVESEDKDKFLITNSFEITGYDSFGNVFGLVSDIEKIKGLEIESVCFGCDVEEESLLPELEEIGFKVKGKAYVYSNQQ